MRRFRAAFTKETFRDTAGLISQYAGALKEQVAEAFALAVGESMRLRNAGIRNRYRWNRELKPSLIHKILREKILPQHLTGQYSSAEGSL